EIAPDLGGGRQILQAAAEGFNGEPAVIAAPADRRECLAPRDVAAPWHAAIILRYMDMNDVSRMFLVRADRIGFLDIGVKGVVHSLDVGMADLVDMGRQVRHGVEQVALEAI